MATRIPAYRQTQMEIKRFIEARKLGLGDQLPPEAQLAKELGISRPSLREGMKSLESLGIVEARHGEGVFVSAFSFDSIIENLPYSIGADDKKLGDLLQVRAALEIGVISQIVDHISPEDKQRLRELAHAMLEAARQNRTFEREDGEFHATLYRCLDNAFLSRLVDLFWQVFRRMNQASHIDTEQWSLESTAQDHLDIVEMIERGDKAGLVLAHQKHFKDVFARFEQGQDKANPPAAAAVQAQIEPLSRLDLSGRLDGIKTS